MDQPIDIGIYCDLGNALGSGHVMRCLPLAVELARGGTRVAILANFSDDRVQWVRERVTAAGIEALDASSPRDLVAAANQAHEAGRPWRAAGIDSYVLKAEDLAGLPAPLFVIDDEGGAELAAWRDHNPDARFAVINFNGRGIELEPMYVTRWHADLILCGPRYALLNPACTQLHGNQYRNRQWGNRPAKMFVLLGGTDATGNAATIAAAALRAAENHQKKVAITVVAPAQHVRDAIGSLAAPTGSSVHTVGPVHDVPQRMADADIVVTTASTTSWEAACVGTPLAVASVADNQVPNYRLLVDGQRAIGLGDLRTTSETELEQAFETVFTEDLNERGHRAWQLVDGQGAARSAAAIHQFLGLTIRQASAEDSERIWEWRNDVQTRANSASGNSQIVPWENHQTWFEHTLTDNNRHLLIGELDGAPVAMLRFDKLDDDRSNWVISINLAPTARGRGLSVPLLLAAHRWLTATEPSARRIVAEIKPHNAASINAFTKAGYRPQSRTPNLITLIREL